jgi:2-polyprenyl-3-methyl-5-hydroxy-6-metoxy-1,4-benzoquinol methylase
MEETTKRDFDGVARGWDEEPRRVQLAADVTEAIRRAARLDPGTEALDLGCGTGLVTLALAPHVAAITGIDGSAEMLAVLSAKIRAAGLENVRTARIDLDGADPLGGPYDLAVSSMTLHHVRAVDALLARLFAAVRPGGQVALADLEPDGGAFHDDNAGVFHLGFDPADLARRLERAGFADARTSLATTMTKESAGVPREFRIFLATAAKPG